MSVVAIKLTGFACNSFSRPCLVGGHLLFFEFHTVEYIQRSELKFFDSLKKNCKDALLMYFFSIEQVQYYSNNYCLFGP